MAWNPCEGRRSLWSAVALVALLLGASSLRAATFTYGSANWAGYAAEYTGTGSSVQTAVANYVSATWTVPAATASLAQSASGSDCRCTVWVGLDGFGNSLSTVEQVGTISNYYPALGQATYSVWYEMYPLGAVTVPTFNVQPGDSVTASVQYNPPGHPGTFLLSLKDNTRNESLPPLYETSASAQRSSAEWIAEAPSGGHGIAPLPTVGSVTFTDATATFGTESGPIDNPDWQTWQINMNPSSKTNPPYVNAMLPGPPVDTGSVGAATSSFVVEQVVPEPACAALMAAMAATAGGFWSFRRWRRSGSC